MKWMTMKKREQQFKVCEKSDFLPFHMEILLTGYSDKHYIENGDMLKFAGENDMNIFSSNPHSGNYIASYAEAWSYAIIRNNKGMEFRLEMPYTYKTFLRCIDRATKIP